MQETPQPGSESGPTPLKCKKIASGKSGISLAGLWVHWQARREVSEQQAAVLLHMEGRNPWGLAHCVTQCWNTRHLGLIYDYPTHFRKSCLFFQDINFSDRRIIFSLVCSQMPRTILLPTEHAAPGIQLALVGGGGARTQRQAPIRTALSQATCSPLFSPINSLLPSPQGLHPKHLLCFYRKNFQ